MYVRPGARFFVTANDASRYEESDYVRLVTPQESAPRDRQIWVRRKPAEAKSMRVEWDGADQLDNVPLTDLKVIQTRGSSFGYVVREAKAGEISDLSAFPINAPAGAGVGSGRLAIAASTGLLSREMVVVRPRQAGLVWSLAFLPGAIGLMVAWRNLSRRRGR